MFKLVLVSAALMYVRVASGSEKYNCHRCYALSDSDPQGVTNCRHFVNVTETSSCSGGCIFYYGVIEGQQKGTTQAIAARFCSPVKNCRYYIEKGWANKYCQQCQSNYCNTEIY